MPMGACSRCRESAAWCRSGSARSRGARPSRAPVRQCAGTQGFNLLGAPRQGQQQHADRGRAAQAHQRKRPGVALSQPRGLDWRRWCLTRIAHWRCPMSSTRVVTKPRGWARSQASGPARRCGCAVGDIGQADVQPFRPGGHHAAQQQVRRSVTKARPLRLARRSAGVACRPSNSGW